MLIVLASPFASCQILLRWFVWLGLQGLAEPVLPPDDAPGRACCALAKRVFGRAQAVRDVWHLVADERKH